MKNTIKIIIIATIILTACTCAVAEVGDHGEFYPRLAVVTSYEKLGDSDTWMIICTDKDGDEWAFYGEKEDAHIGSVVNLLMWNIGENEEENEIVEVYYEGEMTPIEIAHWMNH